MMIGQGCKYTRNEAHLLPQQGHRLLFVIQQNILHTVLSSSLSPAALEPRVKGSSFPSVVFTIQDTDVAGKWACLDEVPTTSYSLP